MNARKYHWTEEELAYLKENYKYESLLTLQTKLRKPRYVVYAKAYDLRLRRRKPKEREPIPASAEPKAEEAAPSFYGEQPDGSYRCRLGWVFSAEDCRMEARKRREIARWWWEKFERKG